MGATGKRPTSHSFVWGSLASPAERRIEVQQAEGASGSGRPSLADRPWATQQVVLLRSPKSASQRAPHVLPEKNSISLASRSKLGPKGRPSSSSLAGPQAAAERRGSAGQIMHTRSTANNGIHESADSLDRQSKSARPVMRPTSAQFRKNEFLRAMGLSSSGDNASPPQLSPGQGQLVDTVRPPIRAQSPVAQPSTSYHLSHGVSELPMRRRNSDSSGAAVGKMVSSSYAKARVPQRPSSGSPQGTALKRRSAEDQPQLSRCSDNSLSLQQHIRRGAASSSLPRERTATKRTTHRLKQANTHGGRTAIISQLIGTGKVRQGGSIQSSNKNTARHSRVAKPGSPRQQSRGSRQRIAPHVQKEADRQELSKAAALVQAPLSILSTPQAGYPLHLQAVHNLNGNLMQASTLLECEEMGASVAQESALRSLLGMVASGEPHSYMAIKALHFAAFSEESRNLLVSLHATEQVLGMLRAASGLEPELTYAALSFLATLSWTQQADTLTPASSKALLIITGKFLTQEASGVRRLAHQIVQSQLPQPQGLRAAAGNKNLKSQLEHHLILETNKEEKAEIRRTIDYITCVQRFTLQ